MPVQGTSAEKAGPGTPAVALPPRAAAAPAMTPRGRKDYSRLDEVGFDVVEELLSRKTETVKGVADKFGVAEINLRLWRRMRRTRIFCDELEPGQFLEMLAAGETIAEIARVNDLSPRLLEAYAREQIEPTDVEMARETGAESAFARAKDELAGAVDDVGLRRAVERHKIDRFQAERTTKRYSDEKTVRVTGIEGVVFSFNTDRLMPSVEAEFSVIHAKVPALNAPAVAPPQAPAPPKEKAA